MRTVALVSIVLLASCGGLAPFREWPAWTRRPLVESAYPPRLTVAPAECARRQARFRELFPDWTLEVNPLCFARRARLSIPARGTHGLTSEESVLVRRVLLTNGALFGLPFGAAPDELVRGTGPGDTPYLAWMQRLVGHDILVTASFWRVTATAAGPLPEESAPRGIEIEGHFLPLRMPSQPPRLASAPLVARLANRPLVAAPSFGRSPCRTSNIEAGTPLSETFDPTNARVTRGHLLILRPGPSLELREVYHVLPIGSFHTRDGLPADCAEPERATADPHDRGWPRHRQLGFLLDARTGEELDASAAPWLRDGWYDMEPIAPYDISEDGFFAASYPLPYLTAPSQGPPP